uniref:RalBP1-associated Eps domain-containing protein 1 n=1 Tax=Strongyloides venezuelensis TaxID=75913 RepID=A0A0K0FK23_STRVS
MSNALKEKLVLESKTNLCTNIDWNQKTDKEIVDCKSPTLSNEDDKSKTFLFNETKSNEMKGSSSIDSTNDNSNSIDDFSIESENKDFGFRKERANINTSESEDDNYYDSSSFSSSDATESETERKNLLCDEDDLEHENGDAVSNVPSPPPSISTPRPSPSPTIFIMTKEQKAYYEKCFLHLQTACNGPNYRASLDGAVEGNSEIVMDFFEKSRLPPEELSRIWLLSDVNEDGFLNLEEFSMAMHLVVLRIKGGIKIPQSLPDEVRPKEEEPRENEFNESLTSSTTCSSNMDDESKKSWRQFDKSSNNDEGNIKFSCKINGKEKNLKLDDDGIRNSNKIIDDSSMMSNFSKTPPLIVDQTPRAKKLSSSPTSVTKSSTPVLISPIIDNDLIDYPLPPPRPLNLKPGKGHGRSASLDTNALNAIINENTSMDLVVQEDIFSSLKTKDVCKSLYTDKGKLLLKDNFNGENICKYFKDASVQTDTLTNTDFDRLAKQLDNLLKSTPSEENFFSQKLDEPFLDESNLTFEERCHLLRKFNWQLEKERSTLIQIRLQLQLRLEEIEKKYSDEKQINSRKPTQL